MFVYHSHSLSGRIKLETDSEPDSPKKIGHFCQFYDFQN